MRQYSKVEITVMQLLGIMPTYGYDLNKTLGEVLAFTHKNARAITRSLAQMERDGLLSSEWVFPEAPVNGPARKIYSLTDAGRAYLDQCSQTIHQLGHMNQKGKRRP
jgi:PadR family transcriptional regulator, regulatory protein PadR